MSGITFNRSATNSYGNGGNMKTDSHDAPGQLYDLREWLKDRIDGSEETRGEDGLISDFIRQIDALDDQIVGLTRPKTIAEWVAANKYVEPTPASKTQVKRFAAQAQTEPKGCPTPGACSCPAVRVEVAPTGSPDAGEQRK